jgi:hypothetical protein
MRKPARVCFDCRNPIRADHKWTWAKRRGLSTRIHRHCDNPRSYYAKGMDPIAPAPLFDEVVA